MGLLLDLNPDGGMDDGENDEDLEAELMNLVGSGCGGRAQPKKGDGRPVAMAEIERMAALCMKDIDDDVGDEDLEDEDLLAELNEVLEDSEEETSAPTPSAFTPSAPKVTITSHSPATAPSGATGVESMLMERIQMYNTAISNAKAAGESSKVRRYERGLKTLQSMLTSVKKGKPINEEEVPPPVALGGKPSALPEVVPTVPQVPHPVDKPPSSYSQKPSKEAPPPAYNAKPQLAPPQNSAAPSITPDTPAISPLTPSRPDPQDSLKQAVLSRQREYKLAAINAKQNGDINLAKQHYMVAKLPAPKTIAEALHQRMEIYKSAAEGAKSKGDDRKARMHQRIVKQYQDAIKTQKAGRPVNLSDLPMPPCPPLQGSEGGEQNFMGVLETAVKIANQDVEADDDEDMTGAAQHLKHAKGVDPMIEASKSGLPVDIRKVPMAPINEEDFSLSRSRSSPSMSPRSSEQYHALMDLLRKQHDKCMGFCQQFTEYGNIAEAFFEKLMGECMKSIEILKNGYAKGHPVPKCRTEERTFNTVIYSNLTPNDMVLYIIKGVNLPAPPGVSPNDLDASVKFEFPFPSEEAQQDKTNNVKGFKEQFRLNINRSHRAFKRVIQSKGIKFEVIHKGFFKNDRVVGTAQLKLEALENNCDFREFIEVMDGRKATGGKLEVRVKIREPVSGAHLQPITEKWLVLDPVSPLSPPERQKERSSSPPQYKLHSFSLLNFDKERFERKIAEYRKNRRDPPPDLIQQYKDVTNRLQWQKAQLYENVLKRFAHGLSDSIKKYSSEGNRDAAKDALGRLKMVEHELESLQRKRTG
uniref:C2 domain-containing protein n=1 Tax=Periophthalmus magnuspinnatus TaxID=409849 RepID=A0A3B4AU88_9GOBI